MRYTRLGNSGLVVSRLAFGAMTFGEAQGAGGFASIYKVDQTGADALIGQALDGGVTFFDTADAYADGRSEEMLGHALGARRREAVVCTKVGMRRTPTPTDSGLSRRHLLASVEASLKRLGTDYLDLYVVHRPDPFTPLEETLQALDVIVRHGKARYIGFSNWPAWLAAKAVTLQRANGLAPFVTGQIYYSLLTRDFEHELAPMFADAGVRAMVWSPLAGGILSGKYTREDPGGGGGRLTGFDFIPFDRERGYRIVDALKTIAAARGVTPAAVALSWLIGRPAVGSAIVGATRAEQLADNLAAADFDLTPEETAALDAASDTPRPYPAWFSDRVTDTRLDELGVLRARPAA